MKPSGYALCALRAFMFLTKGEMNCIRQPCDSVLGPLSVCRSLSFLGNLSKGMHKGGVVMFNTSFFKGTLVKGTLIAVIALVTFAGIPGGPNESRGQGGVPPDEVADYIHAVIAADRTLYTTHVVNRMQENGIVIASELWKGRAQLPLPAQMLLLSGLEVEAQGSRLKFRLASLWPLEEKNGPANVFEKTGLEVVAEDPSESYSGTIKRGKLKYFKAIYADRAVSPACVECHNGHLLSPKRDFKLGDVMGAVIISFPVE